MTFIIAAGLLLLIVLAALFWTALRKPRATLKEDLSARLRAELSDDVSAGVLSAGDLPSAASDIDVESRPEKAGERGGRRGPWWLLIVLVAVAAGAIYWQTGNWRAAIYGDRAAVMQRAEAMLAQLEAHLAAHPDDKQGWVTLGRAKSAMGHYAAAAHAYGRAVRLDQARSPQLLARWGEAMILADPGHLTQQERRIFSAVLQASPDSIRGLWYGGMLALDAGRRDLAVARWRRLVHQDIPAPMRAFVRSRLAALGAAPAAGNLPGAAPAPRIDLAITLSPQLAAQLQSGVALFVYVRAPSGGPPLAAQRVSPDKFPLHVTLNAEDAMLAHRSLAAMVGKQVVVGVFLSKSGTVTSAARGPQASRLITLQPGANAVTLVLAPAATRK
ncbi:MAG: hypothetical protein L0I62_00520 [Gammaproteobacteria bacterium]|nr:hypothetical protein [Gammaproteobacteria bacterium]